MQSINLVSLFPIETPVDIIEYTRRILFGYPKDNYDKVIKSMKMLFNPICDKIKCKYTFNYHPIPVLYRQSRNLCPCGVKCVSEYNHAVCYACATQNEYPEEFYYHHRWCTNL